MKPTFLRPDVKPMLVAVVSERHPEACIAQFRNSIDDGADGFLLQLETLDPARLNLNDLGHPLDLMGDLYAPSPWGIDVPSQGQLASSGVPSIAFMPSVARR